MTNDHAADFSLFIDILHTLETIESPYMIIGAFATTVYGITRMTYNIDIVVDLTVPRVLELTYTAWDLQPFADDVWAEALGNKPLMRALLDPWETNREATQAYPREAPFLKPGWPRPPFTAVATAGRARRAVHTPLRAVAGGAGMYNGDIPHRQGQGRGAVRGVWDQAADSRSV